VTQHDQVDPFVQANLRRNFLANIVDTAFFMLGFSLVSQTTVMPLLVSHLTDSKVVIGLIPALNSLGILLPQLLVANYTEGLPRKMPVVAFFCMVQRLPLPLIGLAVWLLAGPMPGIALVLLLFLRTVIAVAGGLIIPAWFDVIAKEIPVQKRGLYAGLSNGVGALLGIAGAALAGQILSTWVYPQNFAIAFVLAFVLQIISWVALTFNREPDSLTVKRGLGLGDYLRSLPHIVRRDRGYLRYLGARSVVLLGSMATGFYMVYGAERFGVAERDVGLVTALLVGSQAVSNLVWGIVADRIGHKRVLIGEAVCVALAAAVASFAVSPVWLWVTFILMGISVAASGVSALTIVLEFSGPEERPTYIGLTNTLLAPVAVLAPIFGGWLAGWRGYETMFLVAGLLALLGAILMAGWVREPRERARPALIGG
jgi:MFS family permease